MAVMVSASVLAVVAMVTYGGVIAARGNRLKRFLDAFKLWESKDPVIRAGAVRDLERLMTEWDEMGRSHIANTFASMLAAERDSRGATSPEIAAVLDALRRQRRIIEKLEPLDLHGVQLEGADLRGIHLAGAKLKQAWLRDADLRGVNLRGADLQYAHLIGAKLTAADFTGADLTSASLDPEVRTSGIPGAIGVVGDAPN